LGVDYDHGFHVVVEHLPGYTTEQSKCLLMAFNQGIHPHIGDKAHKAHAAIAQGGTKGIERLGTPPKLDPIDLHLQPVFS
jgi:hypothetical protein